MKKLLSIFLIGIVLSSCTENYSKGERIGVITKFVTQGLIWKSWEGELHVTQTGMNNTMREFDFSIDNNKPVDQTMINTLDSAMEHGWKVKVIYHACHGENMTGSRGHTDCFVDQVEVLDKNFAKQGMNQSGSSGTSNTSGHVIDTIYVVIDKSQLKKK
jgi:hypothetical protein